MDSFLSGDVPERKAPVIILQFVYHLLVPGAEVLYKTPHLILLAAAT